MIRLLCVEDDPMMRAYLATRLAGEPGIQLVNAVPDTATALIDLSLTEIDVVLLDYQLQGPDGISLVRRMCPWVKWAEAQDGRPAILFCTGYATEEFCARARLLGARGVVAKERLASDLIPAIHSVAAGGFWFHDCSVGG